MQSFVVEIPPDFSTWGESSYKVSTEGTYLVTRLNNKSERSLLDLHPHHVEALERFYREVLLTAMRPLTRAGRTNFYRLDENFVEERKSVMEKFESKEMLEDFFEQYRKMKIDEGNGSWAEVKSPYEVDGSSEKQPNGVLRRKPAVSLD